MTTATIQFTMIDTIQFSKKLRKAGIQQEAAEVIAEEIKHCQDEVVQGFTRKDDIAHLEQKVDVRISSFENGIDLRFTNHEQKMDSSFRNHEQKMDIKFANFEQRMDSKFEIFKKDLIIKLGGTVIFSAFAVAGFIAWFLNFALEARLPH